MTLRPLLIVEACNPEWVSVPLVGWSHSRAIAALTDRAHIVTQIRNRAAILRAGLIEGRDFTAIDSEAVARPLHQVAERLRGGPGKGWTMATAFSTLAYPYFEYLVWKRFERRIRRGEFNLVHRLIPLSPTTPSSMAARCRAIGVPFIAGPLNGGLPWPTEFDAARRKEREWLSYLRDAYRLMPGALRTRRDAAALLIGSRATFAQVPRNLRHKCFYVPENAIDPQRFQIARTRKATIPLRAIFIGRLVPYKGADMLLEAALPLLKAGSLTLDIIGEGPEMAGLRAVLEREGVGGAVRLPGWVEHQQVQYWLAEADLFTFPSIREFGGAAVLEAMAVGAVPIVIDYGGPGELVTKQTGYLLPMGSRQTIIRAFRDLLTALVNDPSAIDAKSLAARRRAHEQFSWDAKAKQVVEIYRWAIDPGAVAKPVCPMPTPDAE